MATRKKSSVVPAADPAEPYSVLLARTTWKGDSPLVIDALNKIIETGEETNRILTLVLDKMLDGDRLETLLSMISDNTLCACEGINKLVAGVPEPPVSFPVRIESAARVGDTFGYNTTVMGGCEVWFKGEKIADTYSEKTWDGQGSFPFLSMFTIELPNVQIGDVLTLKYHGSCMLREPNFPDKSHRLFFGKDREWATFEVVEMEDATYSVIELTFVDADYWLGRPEGLTTVFDVKFRRELPVNWTVRGDYHLGGNLVTRFTNELLQPNIRMYKNGVLFSSETNGVFIETEKDVESTLQYMMLTVGDTVDIRYNVDIATDGFEPGMLFMQRAGKAVNAGVLSRELPQSVDYMFGVRYLVVSLSERYYIQEVPVIEATGVDWSITARYNVHESIVQRYAGEEVEIKCRLFKNDDQLSNVGVGEKISQVVSWDLINLHTDLRVGDEIRLSYEISSDNLEMMNDIGLFQGGSLHSGMTVTYNEGGLKYEVVGRVYSLDEGTHFIDHPDLRLRDL